MKIIIALILICIATTTYASTSFAQAYKNAKTSTQKIRVLFGELKAKQTIIESQGTEIAKLKSELQNTSHTKSTKEQELINTIFTLNVSNEEKDQEIQRLGKRKVTDYERCDKDYWDIDKKDPLRRHSASTILNYNYAERQECLAGKR